jgi:hypothetical protein
VQGEPFRAHIVELAFRRRDGRRGKPKPESGRECGYDVTPHHSHLLVVDLAQD